MLSEGLKHKLTLWFIYLFFVYVYCFYVCTAHVVLGGLVNCENITALQFLFLYFFFMRQLWISQVAVFEMLRPSCCLFAHFSIVSFPLANVENLMTVM